MAKTRANGDFQFWSANLGSLVRLLAAMVLSGWVMAAFLSHWSLLDGSPRNSLQLFLDGQADRPFAYRILAPALVRGLDAALPVPVQVFLADRVAPEFRANYVQPLAAEYEKLMPGITMQADSDWARPAYRRSYVLMVILMFSSFAGALLLVRRAARKLGAGSRIADAAMLIYAVITPTMFLNGGYFYDFTEQLGATALICSVLEARWTLALVTLLLMQANKETALLMVFFLAPYTWRSPRWLMILRAIVALLLCVSMLLWVRWSYSHSPGQPTEWHLTENLSFWLDSSSWKRTADFYSSGIVLPRMTYLYFAVATLVAGWWRGATPTLVGATCAFSVLAGLMLTMGFRDEFRSLSLATPMLVLVLAEGMTKRWVKPIDQPASIRGIE